MEIIIREAVESDIPVIREMDRDVVLYVASLDGAKDPGAVTIRHRDVFERWLNIEQQKIYLAFEKKNPGVPIGFVWVVTNTELFTGLPYCFVLDIGIKEGFRRAGIGKALMEKATEYARSLGYKRLKLMVNTRNRGAIGFYRGLGFRVEDLYMKKEL